MPIQHFWTATSSIAFPTAVRPVDIEMPMPQLRKIYFHSPTKRLVGGWIHTTQELNLNQQFGVFWRVGYINRDGSVMDMFDLPVMGLNAVTFALCGMSDGRVVRAPTDSSNQAYLAIKSANDDDVKLFPITSRWAHDILTSTVVGSWSTVSDSPASSIVFPGGTAWVLNQSTTGSTTVRVIEEPAATTLLTKNGLTYRHARDIIFIDFKTVAITFMQDSGGAADPTQPAFIRVYDTTTNPWTEKWTDMLPGTDNRACYDQVNQVLYSCRSTETSIINASRLRQMPVTISIPTLVTGSTLITRTATNISVLVTNELNSAISGATVKWTLTGGISGGALTSNYSKTTDEGAAIATYIGPNDTGGGTQTISAEVAEIWPKGLI